MAIQENKIKIPQIEANLTKPIDDKEPIDISRKGRSRRSQIWYKENGTPKSLQQVAEEVARKHPDYPTNDLGGSNV